MLSPLPPAPLHVVPQGRGEPEKRDRMACAVTLRLQIQCAGGIGEFVGLDSHRLSHCEQSVGERWMIVRIVRDVLALLDAQTLAAC